MTDELRTCRRTGCRWPAAASLSFRYDTGQAWLLDLVSEPEPSLWDLCPHHADNLTVPRGWERVDQRTVSVPPVEPAGRDLVTRAHRRVPAVVGGPTEPRPAGNRYAGLWAELPRLAAELAGDVDDLGESVGQASDAPSPPVPSRELAPMPSVELAATAVSGEYVADEQLAMPFGEARAGEPDAVVVPFEAAGRRARERGLH